MTLAVNIVDPLALVAALVFVFGAEHAWSRNRPLAGAAFLALALFVLFVGSIA